MNVLITGVEGQLGHTLLQMLQYETDWSFRGLSRSHFTGRHIRIPIDPYSKASWRQAFDATDWYPNVIVNTAAMTNVDRCEVEREGGWKSNAQLTETITRIARIFDAKVIQISTDYVFDGVAGPYSETDKPNPINYYGKTKLAAENICAQSNVQFAIVRTMWLYGHQLTPKLNFLQWLHQELSEGRPVNIVNDEFGNPTLLQDFIYAIYKVISKDISGIIHISGDERMSRLEFAYRIADQFKLDSKLIRSVSNAELGRPAQRPLQSGLLTLKAKSMIDLEMRPLKHSLMIAQTMKRRWENIG